MSLQKQTALAIGARVRDPFTLLRQMASDFDGMFGPSWPSFRTGGMTGAFNWAPEIDVFQKDNRLVTKVDLPGMKKEDVTVEVVDGCLAISGERKREAEEKRDEFYRSEREYGSFYRAVALPQGAELDDVKATFADGVLEVSIGLPAAPDANARKVEIHEPAKVAKTAA